MAKRSKPKTFRPVHPNAGLQTAYQRKLDALVAPMTESVLYWVSAAYKANPPILAQDAEPPPKLTKATINRLRGIADGTNATVSGASARLLANRMMNLGLIKRDAKSSVTGFQGAVSFELTEVGKIALAAAQPATSLTAVVADLTKQWQDNFDDAAPKLAEWFATEVEDRSSAQLRKVLKDGGYSVKFQMTPAQTDILQATINENVNLIKSIPQQYLKNVQGAVMRSVQKGGDLATLTNEIEAQYGVTRRRAILIARDQNNKATASMTRARQIELKLFQASWLHSGGGKHPRPKHVKASGTVYDVRQGLPIGDKGQYVLPGEEINCRCVSKTLVPGFT